MKKINKLMVFAIPFLTMAVASCKKKADDKSSAIAKAQVTLNAGGGHFSNGKSELLKEVTVGSPIGNVEEPTLDSYTFDGWYTTLDGGSKWNVNTDVVNGNMSLYAHWYNEASDYCTVTFDCDGGAFEGGETTKEVKVKKGEKVANPGTVTKSGYDFVNWTVDNQEWSFIGYVVTENITIKANWNIVTYSISYSYDGAGAAYANDVKLNNPVSYNVETPTTTLEKATIEGVTVSDWKDEKGNVVKEIKKGTTGNLKLTATVLINSYNLTLTTVDATKGTVSGNGSYAYDSSVTVTATSNEGYSFSGWYENSVRVSESASYTFKMPAKNYSLVAKFKQNTIEYGSYPQTRVTDATLISALNSLSSTEANSVGYYSYNGELYCPQMAYTFVTSSTDKTYFIDGTEVTRGLKYWFKVEPIEWKVLDDDNGELFLTSSILLDAREYNEIDYSHKQTVTDYQGNTGEAYCNNYKYCSMRTWLNTEFYNMAFASENSRIKTVEVDNSASTLRENVVGFDCENTNDKVFLLSQSDFNDDSYGLSNHTSRLAKTTDFAICRRLKVNKGSEYQRYWTRSPYRLETEAECITHEGDNVSSFVKETHGVRPAIKLAK